MDPEQVIGVIVGTVCIALGLAFIIYRNSPRWLLERTNQRWACMSGQMGDDESRRRYEDEARAVQRFVPLTLLLIGGILVVTALR